MGSLILEPGWEDDGYLRLLSADGQDAVRNGSMETAHILIAMQVITDLVEHSSPDVRMIRLTARNVGLSRPSWPPAVSVANRSDIAAICDSLKTAKRVTSSHPEVLWECRAVFEQHERELHLNIAFTINSNAVVDVLRPGGVVKWCGATYQTADRQPH